MTLKLRGIGVLGVLGITKGFQSRNSTFLINFTCPQSSSSGELWSKGYCCSESELTQTTSSLRIDKNSNISTWFTFLRELCFSPGLSCTPLRHIIKHSVINIGYHFLSKRAKQTYFWSVALESEFKEFFSLPIFFLLCFFFLINFLLSDTCSFSCCKSDAVNCLRSRISCIFTLLLGTFVDLCLYMLWEEH